MQVKTQGKFLRVAPLKARIVADQIRGTKASDALSVLNFMPQKAAKIVSKVVNTAMADAEHNYMLDKKDLVISEIYIDKGPYFKRMRPAAKGTPHFIERKTSHITVVVSGETKIKRIKKETPKEEAVVQDQVASSKDQGDKLEKSEKVEEKTDKVEKVEKKAEEKKVVEKKVDSKEEKVEVKKEEKKPETLKDKMKEAVEEKKEVEQQKFDKGQKEEKKTEEVRGFRRFFRRKSG